VQLLALQCRLGQGWLFSRALRYDDLIAAYGAIAAATVPLTAPLSADLAGNVAESLRLAALKASRILDTDPEPAFDALVSLASQLMVAPIALVSLIDADRQWFKARVGIDVTETTRDLSFCAVALTQPDRPLIVTDASTDPRFSSNPMVTSAYHIRAYAGVLIHSREGLALGTLCVIDTEPRSFSDEQVAQLELLAEQAAELIDLRRRAAELDDLYCRAGRLSGASHVSTGLPQVSTLASIDYERLHAVVDGWRGHVTEGQATGARARGGGARREATNAQVMERDPEAVAMWLAATRALLRVETSAEAITVCSQLIDDVGGWTIPARLDDGRAVPIDCSFGHGEPLFPMAASTLARTRLRLILPDLLDDARRAIERIHERDDLIEQTRTDSLTGLMNRRAVDHVLVSLQPNDALVVIDLDDFKSVNDRWGHAVGDEVLIAVTAVLREQGRAGDVFARLGGDELLAVLFDVGEHGLQSFMKDLHHAWHRLRPYDVTYTAGAAWVRDRTGPQALAAADAALYSAKAGGRDKVVVEQSTVANQRAC
jgi:diguanylate cyclase (GGDEF)-like protein